MMNDADERLPNPELKMLFLEIDYTISIANNSPSVQNSDFPNKDTARWQSLTPGEMNDV